LAEQLLEGATPETRIAVVSAPSVFIQVKNLLISKGCAAIPKISLLEYDERFGVFPEFIHYDFAAPFRLPSQSPYHVSMSVERSDWCFEQRI